MKYHKGESRPMEEVTLQDMLEYPIWTFALDEEDVEGHDETWQKAIYSTDVKTEYVDVYILLKLENIDQYISANLYADSMTLSDIALWINNGWVPVDNFKELKFPLSLIAIPTIEGVRNVKFIIECKGQEGKIVIDREYKSANLLKKTFGSEKKHCSLFAWLFRRYLKNNQRE